MNIQEITLDVSKRPAVPPVVCIGQGDAGGTTIRATVYDNGIAADLSGMSAMFEMRLPDGRHYVRDGNCAVAGSVIEYVVDESACGSVAGVTDDAYFDVMDGPSVVYSTGRFRVHVLRSARDGAEKGDSWDTEVDGMIARGNALIEDVGEHGGIPMSQKGAASGVAELDENGFVLSSELPSFVDDVLEFASKSAFPKSGETGKIYVDTSDNRTYRWSGSAYVEISPSLALGETSSTAYRGDRGSAAYAHAVTNKGAAFSEALYKITTNSEGHVTNATPATSADIVALLGNQALAPASVTATGTVKAATVEDSGGTLAALRESVSRSEQRSLSGGYFYNTAVLVRHGNVCMLRLDGVANLPPSSTTTLADLPEWARPPIDARFDRVSLDGYKFRFFASTGGRLDVYNYQASTTTERNLSDTLVWAV